MEPNNQPAAQTNYHNTTTVEINSQDLQLDPAKHSKSNKHQRKPRDLWTKKQKIIFAITLAVFILLAAATTVIIILANQQDGDRPFAHVDMPEPIYSVLTGEEITDAALNSSPTYCIQTPNGTDGARPQVGLNQAGVVFEAIAEAGITRFAAIYQNPTSSMIGPVRSLRIYYLNWDTPFNCTIVHAGGADDALAALRSGGYRNHDENLTYMWRDNTGSRRWNNLFTSSSYLAQFNADNGFNTSTVTGFNRMTPEEASAKAADNYTAAHPEPVNSESATTGAEQTGDDASKQPAEPVPLVEKIAINFGNVATYNTVYTYNAETNTYLRAYGDGDAHMVYSCPAELKEPNLSACGDPVQIAPKVVIAMVVQESRASDNYHENITSLGSGKAYIFQNGEAIVGTWSKPNAEAQIEFKNADGNVIQLGTGQTWIAAVPDYGSVQY